MTEIRTGQEITKAFVSKLFMDMIKNINSIDVSQMGDMSTGQFGYVVDTNTYAEPFNRSSDQYADTTIHPHTDATTITDKTVLQKYDDELTKLERRA